MVEIFWETICTVHGIWKSTLLQKQLFAPALPSGGPVGAFIYSHLFILYVGLLS